MSGGSESINIFANAGYFYQDGQISNNNYDRMTLRLNTDAKVTEWLKVGLDINIRQSQTKKPSIESTSGIINKSLTFTPVFSGENNDNTWGYGQNGDNPIAISKAGGVKNITVPELGIKGYLEIKPFEGLSVLTSYSSRKVNTKSDSFVNPYDTYEGGVFKTTYPSSGTHKDESWDESINNQFNVQASYEKKHRKHYLKGLIAMQTEEWKYRNFGAGRFGFNYSGYEELNNGDIATATNYGSRTEWAMLSYFSRINYSYAGRYLLELDGRWDASSRFLSDYRWGFFPSISGGWRISEENFFRPLRNTIDNFKLRISYGSLGNQSINSNYPYAASINNGYGYRFDKTLGTGVAQGQVANSKISWETSKQTNIGIDGGLFKSRLNVSFDYYIRNINDMLQIFPVPLYVGMSAPWENAGSMKNKGWDLNLSWKDKINGFSYYATANLSDVKNEITNLYGNEYIGSSTITKEGLPLYSWYGYVADGYFQNQEEIDKTPVYGGKKDNVKPGYIKYKDITGDGVINDKDRKVIGDPAPHYEFSLNLGAAWKNLDLSLFFQGVGKKDLLYAGSGARPFYIGRTIYEEQLDFWTPENRDAKYPLLLIDGTGNNPNNIISSFWVKSGSFIRMKNVVVGYTLPKSILENKKVNNFRLYASVQNLFTICSAYKGYDPENSVLNGNFYPVMQTFTFGVNISF